MPITVQSLTTVWGTRANQAQLIRECHEVVNPGTGSAPVTELVWQHRFAHCANRGTVERTAGGNYV